MKGKGELIETFNLLKGMEKKDFLKYLQIIGGLRSLRAYIQISKKLFCLDIINNFLSRVVDAWNKSPQSVIDAVTVNSFKYKVRLDTLCVNIIIV